MYSVRVITALDEFVALKDEWNTLWLESAYGTPYQRWEWNHIWILSAGQERTLYVVVIEDDNGKLCGIAPLRISFSLGAIKVLSFISQEATAYPDFIIHRDANADIIYNIVLFLEKSRHCSALDLKIAEPSPYLNQLRDALRQTSWHHFSEEGYTKRLKISIGDNYDAYIASLSKDMRQDVRGANRKLGEKFAVQFTATDQDSDFETNVEDLFRLHAMKWGGDSYSSLSAYRTYYCSVQAGGGVKMFVLTCDGAPVGAVAASLLNDTIYLELAGFDFSILKVDLGKVFYSNLIRWAIAQGFSYIDFMTGEQEYKYRYNPEQTVKWKLSAYKSEPTYFIVDTIHNIKKIMLKIKNKIGRSNLYHDRYLRIIVERLRRKGRA
jgi:CelD/BcsL family acetyltransferase involved in cellulose biosynthesis